MDHVSSLLDILLSHRPSFSEQIITNVLFLQVVSMQVLRARQPGEVAAEKTISVDVRQHTVGPDGNAPLQRY